MSAFEECHFKVAKLKMRLRRLVPGAVSRRVGWEVVLEGGRRMFGNGGGGGVGWVAVLCFPTRDCLKWALAKRQRRRGCRFFLWDSPSCPADPPRSSETAGGGRIPGEVHIPERHFSQISSSPLKEMSVEPRKRHISPKPFPPISSIFGFPAHTNLHRPGLEYEAPWFPISAPLQTELIPALTSSLPEQYLQVLPMDHFEGPH